MTTQPQPEAPDALRLATDLEVFASTLPTYSFSIRTTVAAAAELRRLHAVCVVNKDNITAAPAEGGANG